MTENWPVIAALPQGVSVAPHSSVTTPPPEGLGQLVQYGPLSSKIPESAVKLESGVSTPVLPV